MASEFLSLSNKIRQLAELTEQLRAENVELRVQLSRLSTDNQELNARMQYAAMRVRSLMENLPANTEEEKA